ncbi:MAG: hypothetical protein JW788_03965 [Candidatus Omnitrophica bacterium]|nr:hypothetical protein [Candidatus Omnitrophota bacterium]
MRKGFVKKKEVVIKDFRENDNFQENIDARKEKVEAYILQNGQLEESVKNNLRDLAVTNGQNQEQVRLLLGEPDKIQGKKTKSQLWIYKINKTNSYNVFILPVFFPNEGYYLYFKEGVLSKIERHYIKQVVHQGYGPGVFVSEEKEE